MVGAILSMRDRRSESFTSTLTNPDDRLWWGLGARRSTASGQTVSEERALGLPAYLQGVRIIAEAFSSFPMSEFERGESGRKMLTDDPVHQIVHDEPNGYMTADVWNMLTALNIILHGNSYDENVWNRRRTQVGEVHPIDPRRVTVEPWTPRNGKTNETRLKYHVAGTRDPLDQEDVTHARGLGDNYYGWSPIKISMESLGTALATQQHTGEFWQNGAKMVGVLQMDTFMEGPKKKKFIDSFKEKSAKGETPLLEGGMKFIPLSMPMDQAQYIETRRMGIIESAQTLNMPPALLGERDANYNNEEQLFMRLFKLTLLPLAVRIEKQRGRKLLTPEQRRNRYFKFNMSAILRPDAKTQAEVFHWGLEDGYYHRDEVREMIDKDQLPNGHGTILLYPANKVPAEIFAEKARRAPELVQAEIDGGGEPAPTPEEQPPGDAPKPARSVDDRSFADLFSQACRRLARLESDKVRRALKKPDDFLAWKQSFLKEHEARVRDEFAPIMVAHAAALQQSPPATRVDDVARHYCYRLTRRMDFPDGESIGNGDDAEWILKYSATGKEPELLT